MSDIDKPTIFVTRKLPQTVEKRLSTEFKVSLNTEDRLLSKAELKQAIAHYDGILCSITDQVDAEIISHAIPGKTILANFGVGYGNIDIQAAKKSEVVVTNTPDVLTDATADIAVLLMLAATRRAYEHEQILRQGKWEGFTITGGLGTSLQQKTLGIIGMGRIGQATARRAALGFGMKIIYHNRSAVGPFDFPAEQVADLDTVMAQADIVSIHAPSSGSPIVTADHLAKMKPSGYFINTARGDVVDQQALINVLRTKKIAGAGLDVFDCEPNVPTELIALENVTLLPHIGSATIEVREAMGMLAVDNLIAHFTGAAYPSRVI